MANLLPIPTTLVSQSEFRYIKNIEELNDYQLDENGYYRGYPCPHGHSIRDLVHHWCYHCVFKIQTNICGFDINYLHAAYKSKYHFIWKKINVGHPDECWTLKISDNKKPRRICMPSYRSLTNNQKSDNVNIHKAIYQCAWGDVGSMIVTRTCQNSLCQNPLHMVSSWNRVYPPAEIVPFCIDFEAEKLMQYANLKDKINIQSIVESKYKNTIKNPLELNETSNDDGNS